MPQPDDGQRKGVCATQGSICCPGDPVYFAHPHSPWERGTNENTDGLIREYLPKGIDFREVRNDDVLRIVERLSNRPKSLSASVPLMRLFSIYLLLLA